MKIARRVKETKTTERTIIKVNPYIYYPLWISGFISFIASYLITVPWPLTLFGAAMVFLPLFRIEPDRGKTR